MTDSAAYYNQQVTPTNIADSLQKLVNNDYICFIRSKSLPENQLFNLRQIAMLCPLEYGSGVYNARALLAQADSILVIYNNVCEYGLAPKNKSMEEETQAVAEGYGVAIYPNPAGNSLNVQIDSDKEGLAQFVVFDLMGKKILDTKVSLNETNAIDISGIGQGVYYYILTHLNKPIKTDKLVIIK